MKNCRTITCPPHINYPHVDNGVPRAAMSFSWFVAKILLRDNRFAGERENIRSGDRILEAFEIEPDVLKPAGSVVEVHEADWLRLCEVSKSPTSPNATPDPDLARRALRFKWFEAIEEAPESINQ